MAGPSHNRNMGAGSYLPDDCSYLQPSFSIGYGIGENIPALCDLYLNEDPRSSHDQLAGASGGQSNDTSLLQEDLSEWQGKECEAWAFSVMRKYRLDELSVDLWQFSTKTGQELLSYSLEDFCLLAGNSCGNIFYQEFLQMTAKQRTKAGHGTSCTQNEPYAGDNYYCGDNWHSSVDRALMPPPEDRDRDSGHNLVGGIRTLGFQESFAPASSYAEQEDKFAEDSSDGQAEGADTLFKRIPSTRKSRKRGPKTWEFLYRLLTNPEFNPSLIRWEDQSTATFRLVRPDVIAQMWGARNNQPNLIYNNFARGLRYHYKTGILIQVSDRQLVYRFGEPAFQYLKSSLP